MQFIAYILIYPLLWLISILPFWLLYKVSDGVYFILYYIIGYRKKVVLDNLRLVFPEKSENEILKITKAFYKHLCDMIVEAIKSISISKKEMQKRYVYTNVDVIHRLEEKNRSILFFMAHYASWEWTFILQTYINHKGYAVYKRLRNKHFDKLVKRIRAQYNSQLITTKETFSVLARAKKNNELTINGFAFDQSPKPSKAAHWQKFMGIKVPVYVGGEILAKRLDMATLFLKVKKVKRGYYEATFHELSETPKDFADFKITDMALKLVEEEILEAPEHYLWTHKRWKHRDKAPK